MTVIQRSTFYLFIFWLLHHNSDKGNARFYQIGAGPDLGGRGARRIYKLSPD